MFPLLEHTKNFEVSIVNYAKWPSFSDIHYHNGYELYYLLSGNTKYIIENATYEINKGDVVIIPPYTNHITRPNDKEHYKRVLVNFSQVFLDNCINEHHELTEFLSHPRIIRIDSAGKNLFRRVFNILVEEYLSGFPDTITAQKGLLLTCLINLKRLYDDSVSHDGRILREDYPDISQQLKILIKFIQDNYASQITLEDISSQVNLNPAYVSSLFKKSLGYTFKEYLINVRLNKACKLLKSSTASIEKVSHSCGFNSCNHFCKTFKKHIGISPATYRNSDKSTENPNDIILW